MMIDLLSWSTTNNGYDLTVTGFTVHNERLHAVAHLEVTVMDAAGRLSPEVLEGILLPVRIKKSTARILKLEFDPLPLELLGVKADQGKATLEITSPSSPGLFPGDLLWAIAHLHDDPFATPHRMASFLNRLLTATP
jgi:hypothetical protein